MPVQPLVLTQDGGGWWLLPDRSTNRDDLECGPRELPVPARQHVHRFINRVGINGPTTASSRGAGGVGVPVKCIQTTGSTTRLCAIADVEYASACWVAREQPTTPQRHPWHDDTVAYELPTARAQPKAATPYEPNRT